MSDHHLAYGDIIRIYCTLQDIQQRGSGADHTSSKIAGFLMSKGFADNNIYFLKSKKFTEFEFRNSLFEILPYSSFEIHDEDHNRKKNPKKSQDGKQPQLQREHQQENIKSRKNTEIEQFKSNIVKKKGTNINFDAEVIIKHVNSDSYLQGEFSCPETGIGSFKLILSNQLSSLIKFKIIRFRNSDKEAEEIQSKDEFRLHHCASHCFLNIGNQQDQVFLDKPLSFDLQKQLVLRPDLDNIFDHPANMYHNMRPMIKHPTSITASNPIQPESSALRGSSSSRGQRKMSGGYEGQDVPKRYEVVNQSKATLILNFIPEKASKDKFKKPDKEEKKGKKVVENEDVCEIQHNDVVYLKNTKNDSYLTVDMWTGDVYLKKNKNYYEGLWEICVKRDQDKGLIQPATSKVFYLKHYITDAIAKVVETKVVKEQISEQPPSILDHSIPPVATNDDIEIKVDPQFAANSQVLRLVQYPNVKSSLKHRDLVVISVTNLDKIGVKQPTGKHQDKSDSRKRFIDIDQPIKKIYMRNIEQKADSDNISFSLKICQGDLQNTFQIFRLDSSKLKNINKILSCQQALTKFCDILIVFNKLLKYNNEKLEEEKANKVEMKDSQVVERVASEMLNRGKRSTIFVNQSVKQPSPRHGGGIDQASRQDSTMDRFFNKYLNSYILQVMSNTTRYLKNNCSTGTKTEFDFIIMIKSLGMIEILIEMIYFMEQVLAQWDVASRPATVTQENMSKRKYERDRVFDIFKEAYLLLSQLSKENSCKTYLARWINLFLKQYYKLKKDYIHEFILQILKNQYIIKNCITKQDISECISECTKDMQLHFDTGAPDQRYLQLLSSFCRTKDKAVPGNQLFLMKKFLLDAKNPCVFRFECHKEKTEEGGTGPREDYNKSVSVMEKEDILIITKNISNGSDRPVPMSDHVKFRKMELWTYTIVLLNLIADVSYDQSLKNQMLEAKVEGQPPVITLGVVQTFFKNRKEQQVEEQPTSSRAGKLNNNVNEPFLKLAHYYLKQNPDDHERLQRNASIIVWDKKQKNYFLQQSFPDCNTKSLFDSITIFFKQLFKGQVSQKSYNVKRLKTIQTALDFIKTIMRTKRWTNSDYQRLIPHIINSVLKIKSQVIYKNINLQELHNALEKDFGPNKTEVKMSPICYTVESELTEENIEQGENPNAAEYLKADKTIEKNCSALVNNKELLRLLIDTRSLASQILDIRLDIINNNWLESLVSNVFLKLYKNDFTGTENDVYSPRYKMTDPPTWVNQITKICNSQQKQISRLRIVRCLIECFFVDSLKIVDKMLVLMFKIYESRKILLNSFSNCFICYESFYKNLYKRAKIWISSFEKIKQGGKFDLAMKELDNFSYGIRFTASIEQESDEDEFESKTVERRESREEKNREEYHREKKEELSRRVTLVMNQRESKFDQRQKQVQKLLINTKIHQFVLKYAKSLKPSQTYQSHLNTVYEFLTLLVFDNPRNKRILAKSILDCEKHLNTNYKAIDFMREMIRNNKDIVFKKEIVMRIVRYVLDLMNDNEDYLLKAKLFESLRLFCVYNNKVYTDNQTIILSMLQNKKYKKIMFSTIDYASIRQLRESLNPVMEVYKMGFQQQLQQSGDSVDDLSRSEPQEIIQVQQQVVPEQKEQESEQKEDIPPSIYVDIYESLKEYDVSFGDVLTGKTLEINMDPKLQYLVSYFSTLTSLVDGEHKINVGKCSNMHPYEKLLVLLYDCKDCWPLERYVRAFINRLYYATFTDGSKDTGQSTPTRSNSQMSISKEIKLKTEFFVDKIFADELPLISKHLSIMRECLHKSKNLHCIEKVRIGQPLRYEYIVSYLYMLLIETLFGLSCILNSKDFRGQLGQKLRVNTKNFIDLHKLLQNLGDIYKRYRHIHNSRQPAIKTYLMELLEGAIHCIACMDSNTIRQFMGDIKVALPNELHSKDPDEQRCLKKIQQLSQPWDKNRKDFLFYYFFEDKDDRTNKHDGKDDPIELFQSQYKNLNLKGKGGTGPATSDCDIQLQINERLEEVVEKIKDSEQIKRMAEKELDELVDLCCNLDKETDPNSVPMLNGKPDMPNVIYRVISEKKFLKQVIKLITKSPDHLTTPVKIKALRFLRLIFQKKVDNQASLPNNKWQSSFFKSGDNKKTLLKYQTYFLDLDLDRMIVSILQSESPSYELLRETFMIGVRFLYNGNTSCQMAILKDLKEDAENCVMTQLCLFIKNIRNEIEAEKFKVPELKKNVEETLQQNHRDLLTDTYGYYDSDQCSMMQSYQTLNNFSSTARLDKDTATQALQQMNTKVKCICQAYNFLQLLCENDNTDLKDFLRQQKNIDGTLKYNSVNFLAETTKLFKVVLQKMDEVKYQSQLIKYLAEFFIEVTQIPCLTNQRELCSTSIFSDIKQYISKEKRVNEDSVLSLMEFVISVGLSLLEGNDDEIYNNLLKSLDVKFLVAILRKQNQQLEEIKKDSPECPVLSEIDENSLKILLKEDPQDYSHKKIRKRLEIIFNFFSLVMKLSRYQQIKGQTPTRLQQMTKDTDEKIQSQQIVFMPQTVDRITKNYIEHIEVAHGGKKQFLYFPKLPIFNISQQTMNYIQDNVKRDTQIDKITDFLSKSNEVNNEMNWNYKVENRIAASADSLQSLGSKITGLTIIIEIIFIVSSSINFTLKDDKKEVVKMIKIPLVSSILHFLAIIQLFSTLYYLYVWVTLKYRLSVEREQQKNQTDIKPQTVQKLLKKIDTDADFDMMSYWYCLRLMFEHQPEIFKTLYFIFTSFAGYLFGYEWYSLMIFTLLSKYKTLRNVIQAITLNIKQLFFVSLLILVFVYVFNMISIEFDLYLPFIYEAEEEKCEVLKDCIMSLYTSGIVGTKDQDLRFGRYFTDLIYVVIMELLFSNIVSGIMIDTFAQLRDTRKIIQNDKQNQCFICGISKATIQKRTKQSQQLNQPHSNSRSQTTIFDDHIGKVHKQWNYIYYLYILKQKDITAYTGIEYAIKKEYDDDRFKWVPIEYEKNENDVEELLELLEEKLQKRREVEEGKAVTNY